MYFLSVAQIKEILVAILKLYLNLQHLKHIFSYFHLLQVYSNSYFTVCVTSATCGKLMKLKNIFVL